MINYFVSKAPQACNILIDLDGFQGALARIFVDFLSLSLSDTPVMCR